MLPVNSNIHIVALRWDQYWAHFCNHYFMICYARSADLQLIHSLTGHLSDPYFKAHKIHKPMTVRTPLNTVSRLSSQIMVLQ